jgi:hypothetical protein
MNEDAFHAIMAKVRAAEDWDDACRAAAIASLVGRLKADCHKRYGTQIRPSRADGNWSQPSVGVAVEAHRAGPAAFGRTDLSRLGQPWQPTAAGNLAG